MARTVLTSAATFYVSPNGSNTTGDGLSWATAWATPSHAAKVLHDQYDLAGFTVTIKCFDTNAGQNVYVDSVQISGPFVGQAECNVIFDASASPYSNSTVMRPSSGMGPCFAGNDGAAFAVKGFMLDLSNNPGQNWIYLVAHSLCELTNIRWEGSSNQGSDANCIIADSGSYCILLPGTYYVGGTFTAQSFFCATDYGIIYCATNGVGGLVTISFVGSATFTQGTATVFNGTVSVEQINWSGSTSGRRFYGDTCGFIDTNSGGNQGVIPGNSAGYKDSLVAYR